MNTQNALIYAITLICSLFPLAGDCAAQTTVTSCTPVVYAFRHAEDLSGLTEVGTQHAFLYPEMVADFGGAKNYCPVTFVYSTYEINPDNGQGTKNPYDTARPLAIASCYNFPNVSSQSLATCPFFPRTSLENGEKLYEYLGTKDSEKGLPKAGKSATFEDLRAELLSNTSQTGLSSAIFWTSDGLNALGQAIGAGYDGIPKKIRDANGKTLSAPPRNAVYVFEYQNGALEPPTNVKQYLQCFNVNASNQIGGTTYYCRLGGNLPETLDSKDIPSIRGKICDTTSLGPDCKVIN